MVAKNIHYNLECLGVHVTSVTSNFKRNNLVLALRGALYLLFHGI